MNSIQKSPELTDAINRIEAEMLLEPQVKCELDHFIYGGIYSRVVTIPKLTKVIGRVHKTPHQVSCISGTLEIFTEGEG